MTTPSHDDFFCFDCGIPLIDREDWEPYVLAINGTREYVAVCSPCVDEVETTLLEEAVALVLGRELDSEDTD